MALHYSSNENSVDTRSSHNNSMVALQWSANHTGKMISDNGETSQDDSLEMRFTPECFFILLLTFLIIVSNIIVLLVMFLTEMMTQINKYFFVSLTVADLCIGVFICPFSFWTSMFDHWIYGKIFCHIEAYIAAIFWIVTVFSLMWLGIDHYIAIRKPDRYESLMTPMRSKCWVCIIWVAAISFCSPPLFGFSHAQYYKHAHLCIVDWKLQKAYFITAGLLIIIPPVVALSFSNFYIFTDTYKKKKVVYEKCTDSHSRPNHYFLNFMTGVVFLVSWCPWCILQLQEIFQDSRLKAPDKMHFYFMWLAVGNSFWKFLLYIIFDHDFRIGLKVLGAKMTGNYQVPAT